MFDLQTKYALLGLASVPGIGTKTFKSIVDQLESCSLSDLVDKLISAKKLSIEYQDLVNKGRELATNYEKLRTGWVVLGDANYPKLLSEIADPPKVVYFQGDKTLLTESNLPVSVVGTRQASPSGLKYAEEVAEKLGVYEIPIVSGLAFGVDAAAHLAAVKSRAKTIAVLPGGPHNITPKTHQRLAQKILGSGGLILSELPHTNFIAPGMFPRRNRLIAGLSQATIVIEASIKSGALITARLAFGYDREVMAFPAPAGFASLAGTNLLIKESIASLIENASDVVLGLGIIEATVNSTSKNPKQDSILSLIADKPYTIEQICDKLGLHLAESLARLSRLELSGQIYKDDNLCYRVT